MSSTPSSATPGTYLLRIVLVSMVLLVVAFIVLTAAVRTHAQATVGGLRASNLHDAYAARSQPLTYACP